MIAQITKQLLFFLLHILLYIQTGLLLLAGVIPAPILLGSGILYAIPGSMIIFKTLPHLMILSRQLKVSGILLLALLPTIIVSLSLSLEIFCDIHISKLLPDSYATTPLVMGVLVLPSSILALVLLRPLTTEAASRAETEFRAKPEKIKKSPEQTIVSFAKIFLIVFITGTLLAAALTVIIDAIRS